MNELQVWLKCALSQIGKPHSQKIGKPGSML